MKPNNYLAYKKKEKIRKNTLGSQDVNDRRLPPSPPSSLPSSTPSPPSSPPSLFYSFSSFLSPSFLSPSEPSLNVKASGPGSQVSMRLHKRYIDRSIRQLHITPTGAFMTLHSESIDMNNELVSPLVSCVWELVSIQPQEN